MNYIIKIDNREKELIKLFNNKGYDMLLENLEIGDIQFLDLLTKELIIIIERKTLSDLSSSIKDGRYKEQKERMIHGIKNNVRKIMLIEGDNMDKFDLPLNTLESVIINTLLRDNIHIYISKNIENTIEFIENIISQIPKYYNDLQKEIINGEQKIFNNEFNCKLNKKDNITVEVCFINMLSQIPGVSNNIASKYVNKYKTINNFLIKLSQLPDKKKIIEVLGNELHGVNNRKVGNKVGEKIYNYLFGNCDTDVNVDTDISINIDTDTDVSKDIDTCVSINIDTDTDISKDISTCVSINIDTDASTNKNKKKKEIELKKLKLLLSKSLFD